ncbi:DUF2972 domain-containing protein, partial [Campylobacter sp. TTU-622]|uniref:DUF2972 domain-containing protein n=1 Tax=Campylobacter sp. TTU-622 TaxID=2800583 RepID=UPI0019079E77
LVRDPISRLKTGVNHPFREKLVQIDLNKDKDVDFFTRRYLVNIQNNQKIYSNFPSFFPLNIYISLNHFLQATVLKYFIPNEIIFIDCMEIMPCQAKKTILDLSQKLNFTAPINSTIYQYNTNSYFMAVLPIILRINDILIHVTTHNYVNLNKQSELIDIYNFLFDNPCVYGNLGIY